MMYRIIIKDKNNNWIDSTSVFEQLTFTNIISAKNYAQKQMIENDEIKSYTIEKEAEAHEPFRVKVHKKHLGLQMFVGMVEVYNSQSQYEEVI